jgi:hypothetical protein
MAMGTKARGIKSNQATEGTSKGAVKLRKGANEARPKDSEEIVKALVKSCTEGHIQSIRFLNAGLSDELDHAEDAIKFRNLVAKLGSRTLV